MSNDEVIAMLRETLQAEGSLTARVVALLAIVEERRIYLELAYPNIFEFCRRYLGFSEDESYRRMETARLAQRFPQVIEALGTRRVHMTALLLLRPVLTKENIDVLLAAATGKTKSEVQLLVAGLSPHPDVPSSIRQQPAPRETTPSMAAAAATAAAALGSPTRAPALPSASAPAAPASAAQASSNDAPPTLGLAPRRQSASSVAST